VRGCRVKVSAGTRAQDPKVFTPASGCTSSSAACARAERGRAAIALSHEKYCSATIMLGKTAEIVTSYEIVAADAGRSRARPLRDSARSGSSPRPASASPSAPARAGAGAGALGGDRVAGLVALHLRDDRPRRVVALRQPVEMAREVTLHLAARSRP
jgi:hypothetical protein